MILSKVNEYDDICKITLERPLTYDEVHALSSNGRIRCLVKINLREMYDRISLASEQVLDDEDAGENHKFWLCGVEDFDLSKNVGNMNGVGVFVVEMDVADFLDDYR